MKFKRAPATALQLLFWEGAAAMAYETWVGTTYLSGLAGEFAVGLAVTSLLVAAPALGSVGQLIGLWALDRSRSPKTHAMRWVIAARSLWLLPMIAALVSCLAFAHFPKRFFFGCLTVVACAVSVLATSSASAWMAWMKGLVPGRFFGRFFAVRYRYVMLATILANVVAAWLIGWKWNGYASGYFLVGTSAVFAAGVSIFLLARVPQGRIQIPKAAERGFGEMVREVWNDPWFRPSLIFGALFNGALQLAGPYFPYYFTSELGIPMGAIALWIGIASLGCFIAAPVWGKRIDLRQGTLPILHLCSAGMAISPLFYVFRSAATIRSIAPYEYFVNGVFSGGYTLAFTALQLRVAPARKSGTYFSVYTAMAGVTGAGANFIGGRLAMSLPGGFRALWWMSAGLRLVVALWGIFYLRLYQKGRSSQSCSGSDGSGNPLTEIPSSRTGRAPASVLE